MNNLSLGENTLSSPHYPVLLSEIIENLQPQHGIKYLDCTFGAGGYTKAILDTANCFVKALDQDPTVYKYAEKLCTKYKVLLIFENRLRVITLSSEWGIYYASVKLPFSAQKVRARMRARALFSFCFTSPPLSNSL